ncbi:hypothetical protein RB195_016762 [Necator americanus]
MFHSLSNGLLVSSYIFWVAPCIFFDFSSLFAVNRSVGQMTIIAQAGSYFSMLLLSLNRFVCVFAPTRYMDFFTNKSTFIYISIITIICLGYGCVYFEAPCFFIFDRSTLEFTFSASSCGQILSKFMDFWFGISLFSLVCCLDILTLIKLRLVIRDRNVQLMYGSTNRFKKDLRLFAQTICTTILFSFTVVCFHYISTNFVDRFTRFCSTTLIWGINHTGAGIIVAVFNNEIRRNIFRPLRSKYSSSAVVTSVVLHRTRTTINRRVSTVQRS